MRVGRFACLSCYYAKSPARKADFGLNFIMLWSAMPRRNSATRSAGQDIMTLQALGYVGIGSDKLDDWAGYATRFLGMQLVDRSSASLALRMDDRKQRVIVSAHAPSASFYGWEVADADALEQLAARLETAGVRVARGGQALADQRRVQDLI